MTTKPDDEPEYRPLSELFRSFVPKQDTEEQYFESLGRFIAAYAIAEAGVHELTRALSKLSEAKARVIFAGMRLGDLIERTRAMLRIEPLDAAKNADIEGCLVHIDAISAVRNKLVHRHVSYTHGTFVVTNTFTAKSREGIQVEIIDRSDLDAMAQDCRVIFLKLANAPHNYDPETETMRTLLGMPWRYTPAPPAPPKTQRQKAPQAPPPPPDASRE